MNGVVFRKILPFTPPSSNSKSKRQEKEFTKKMTPILDDIAGFPKFSDADRLYGRVFYFNYENVRVRDVHNIFKKLFDALRGYVYEDDKQILHFEGTRLDMINSKIWFDLEFNLSAPELDQILAGTCCLIEVGKLPAPERDSVRITWL